MNPSCLGVFVLPKNSHSLLFQRRGPGFYLCLFNP